MRGIGSTMWKAAGALSLAGLVALGAADTASAGQASNVQGVAACDTVTGNQIITWTFTNNTVGLVDIQSADASGAALTAGSITATAVVMAPATGIASLGTSVGQTTATGDAVGSVSIAVGWFNFSIDAFQTSNANVVLAGGCVAAVTTTTAAPTTTAVDAGAGSLPHVGHNSTTVPLVALSFVGVGVALLALRRRTVSPRT